MKSDYINENYHKISSKIEQLKIELTNLDDETLIEEVMYTSGALSQSIDSIVSKFISKGKLSKKDREQLEWFYIVSYV